VKQFIFHSSQQIARFIAGATSGLPASTGRDNNNKTAVITTAQPNKANFALQKKISVYQIRFNIIKIIISLYWQQFI